MSNRIGSSALVIIGVLCVFMIGFKPNALKSAADEPIEPVVPEGMTLIPAGEFQMGSDDVEGGEIEQPVHTVYVDAFYMDVYEVTNAEYKKFIDAKRVADRGERDPTGSFGFRCVKDITP